MVVDVVMPKYGPNMVEGVVVRWLKRVGDPVAKDEALAEIETEKVTATVQAPDAGLVAALLVSEGDEAAVGTPIARIEVAAA
jgi:pyruvate/2-oxoglutarate dehydrogenase complex dihydrolipoamide acyltransferase (E2) component